MSALGHKRTFAVQKGMSALPPKADICECLAIERERGSVEAIYCGRSLLCRPTYWRGSAGSSDVISAAFNVEFHFDAFGPRVGNEGRGNDLAYAELFSDVL
jgi:hypothetical protein